jgi:hypothetical protein
MASFKEEVLANTNYMKHKTTVSGRFSASSPAIANAPKSNGFAAAVADEKYSRTTTTTNGMKAFVDTSDAVLDFFATAGSARGKNLSTKFLAALAEDKALAVRALLWLRDVREGAGERTQFRNLVATLESHDPSLAARLIPLVPILGRWDDLFAFTDVKNRKAALAMFAGALYADNKLAFKWAPREKSARKVEASALRNALGMTPRDYRKFLAFGTDVIESKMTSKRWLEINFSHVPSVAAGRYQKAFMRNAGEAYSAYVHELKKPVAERDPKVKINAGAVTPANVIKSCIQGNSAVANEQWDALPDFIGNSNILPMVDVSGSMGRLSGNGENPIMHAISLGLYVSGKNKSAFKDLVLTFSGAANLEKISGTLDQRISALKDVDWGMNTNIKAAFTNILNLAVSNNVAVDDMPDTLLILSDMQFDTANESGRDYGSYGASSYFSHRSSIHEPWNQNVMQLVQKLYADAGYTMPKIVFWNLKNDTSSNAPVKFDTLNTALVSGFSPSIMKAVLADDLEEFTPYNVMVKALSNERYDF